MHIVIECSGMAHTEYKKRHDKVATMAPWELWDKYGLNLQIQNQNQSCFRARGHDIVPIDRKKQETLSIDVAIPKNLAEKIWNIKILHWKKILHVQYKN